MDPVAKGWLRASLALWNRLQSAPADSLLGATVRASIQKASNNPSNNLRGEFTWVSKFMSMLDKLVVQESRDDNDCVRDFIRRCGYDATDYKVLAVPSGVVWNAWDRTLSEPWEGLDPNPRTSDSDEVSLCTCHAWFSVPELLRKKASLQGCPTTLSIRVESLSSK